MQPSGTASKISQLGKAVNRYPLERFSSKLLPRWGPVRRLELVEIHEQQWFPQQLRDGVTNILQSVLNLGGYVELVTPLLASALRRTKARRVVDLCAGSGGPWMRLDRLLENHVSICLTDKFPSTVSSERLGRAMKLCIEYAR